MTGGVFAVGAVVTVLVGIAMALLVYGAVLDGRTTGTEGAYPPDS